MIDQAINAVARIKAGLPVTLEADYGKYHEMIEAMLEALHTGGIQAVYRQYKTFKRAYPELETDENIYPDDIQLEEVDYHRIDKYPYTDAGQAEVAAYLFKYRIAYSPGIDRWYIWNSKRWVADDRSAVSSYILRAARERQRAAVERIIDPEDQKAVNQKASDYKTSLSFESRAKLNAVRDTAAEQRQLIVMPDEFDRDRMLFCVQNGVLDLSTGKLIDANPRDYISKQTSIAYYPDATCPRWERFIDEIFDGDDELIEYMQEVVGYCLTGDITEQCFWILHGNGANGKSTFTQIMLKLAGNYGSNASSDTFMQGNDPSSSGPKEDIARLQGQRLVVTSETNEYALINEGRIKAITGGDKITARLPYARSSIEFYPQFKLIAATNHKPQTKGIDDGLWRRVRLVPFNVSFKDRADKNLEQQLEAELPGILAWAVRGAIAWGKRGGLKTPQSVIAATNSYRVEMDVIGQFIDEKCILQAQATVMAGELYNAYCAWCEENRSKALSSPKFAQRLQERGLEKKRKTSGIEWLNIGLLV